MNRPFLLGTMGNSESLYLRGLPGAPVGRVCSEEPRQPGAGQLRWERHKSGSGGVEGGCSILRTHFILIVNSKKQREPVSSGPAW